jgi:hypothetical protein
MNETAPEDIVAEQAVAPTPPQPVGMDQPMSRVPQTSGFAQRHGVQEVTLPSLGLPYEGQIPGGKVLISSITAKEEKVFSTSSGTADSKMNMLFTQTCDLHGYSPMDLVSPDRFFLLVQLRALSYGNKYSFPVKCESCDDQFKSDVHIINDMDFKEAADGWEEPFQVTLPTAGAVLDLCLLRGRDEQWIETTVKKLKSKNKKTAAEFGTGDQTYIFYISKFIKAVNGEAVNDFQAMSIAENFVPIDVRTIRDAVEENSFGYEGSIDIECPSCGFIHEEVRLPVGREFFRTTL